MTWKVDVTGQAPFTEYPTSEMYFDSKPVYRKTFIATHAANPAVGTSYTTTVPGAGHGIGQVIRVEAIFSNSPSYNGTVPIQFLRSTANAFYFYVLNTVTIPANSIRITVWYTKEWPIW